MTFVLGGAGVGQLGQGQSVALGLAIADSDGTHDNPLQWSL